MSRVLLLSHEIVGKSMSGPGIRYYEFAKALSEHHTVTLLIPNDPELHEEFSIIKTSKKTLKEEIKKCDILISQLISPRIALLAKLAGVKIILDAYDPLPIENLEVYKHNSLSTQNFQSKRILDVFRFSFQIADTYLAASVKQRDLWIGFLLNIGKITPKIYLEDPSLKNMIDIVPFGLSKNPPNPNIKGFRERLGLKSTDQVILWGGGIWNWFDPLTLIRAIYEISKFREDIFLVFMGVKPPNPHIPEMEMAQKAVELAKSLNLFDRKIFFNFGWTTYEERQGYLNEANIGISLHFDNLETQFAFRTRILDYIWAGLPIIASRGDFFADFIEKNNLGLIVSSNHVKEVKDAILNLCDNENAMYKENLAKIQSQYYWEEVVKPILRMVEYFDGEPKKKISFQEIKAIAFSLYQKYKPTTVISYLFK